MTLAWMVYAMAVSLLLGGAALAAEAAARAWSRSTRSIWAGAFLASLLLPTVISSVSIELPNIFAASATLSAPARPLVLREATVPTLAPSVWMAAKAAPLAAAMAHSPKLNPLLRSAWLAVSSAMLLMLAVSGAALLLRKRRWQQRTLLQSQVFVASDAGPAVVGLLRPRIVVPSWLLGAPASQQALVIAHEQSHIDARDPQLLTTALCLLVLMPWNLPLWWQLRRLRHAIEVDCDARVLRAGHDVQHYGAALIDVGQRQSGFIGAVAAMAESRSLLEQRIRIMVAAPGRKAKAGAVLLAAVSLCALALAAQVAPPNALQTPFVAQQERHQINVTASRLVDYEGVYQLDEFALLHVTREGRRLWLQVYNQEKMELYAEHEDQFFSRDMDLQLHFLRDGRGRVERLEYHSLGGHATATLLDNAALAAREALIARDVLRTTPMPGGEAVLRHHLANLAAGKMDGEGLSPLLQGILVTTAERLRSEAAGWGKVQSVRFDRVDTIGWDCYLVRFEHIEIEFRLHVNSDGKVAGVYKRDQL